MESNGIMYQIILMWHMGLTMMKKTSLMMLNKQILMMWMIMSKRVLANMENEFSTRIRELGSNKIADENELFDFIIPFDLNHYEEAKDKLTKVILEYEGARKKYHKKNLPISTDLKREIMNINLMLGDLRRLTNLIPDFAKEASKYREKRQLAMIGMGLAGFLFGNLLNSNGETDRMDNLEVQFNLFTKNYLDFEEKQIEVNNELISQMTKMSNNIKKFESDD